ncbi:MAG: DUF89 family protein, partial [Clostridiales bacterium]|nr:DUF89 family protein [Clostridiales bacterium]
MRLTGDCIHCIIDHHWALVRDCPDGGRKEAFMREALRVLSESDPELPPPVPTARLQEVYLRMFPEENRFERLKRAYNELLLGHLPELRERAFRADDPLKLAVWMAMAGNYIDFGILREVDDDKLMETILTPDEDALNPAELRRLRDDLARAKRLTYCLDNCGEIVLDRLLMEVIHATYPQIEIAALARGLPVLNDATRDDARSVGIGEIARVVGNGSNICGTQLEFLSDEALEAVCGADVVIAKGQGNFETLSGTGLNTYYLFLCKCRLYTPLFGME